MSSVSSYGYGSGISSYASEVRNSDARSVQSASNSIFFGASSSGSDPIFGDAILGDAAADAGSLFLQTNDSNQANQTRLAAAKIPGSRLSILA